MGKSLAAPIGERRVGRRSAAVLGGVLALMALLAPVAAAQLPRPEMILVSGWLGRFERRRSCSEGLDLIANLNKPPGLLS